MRTEGIISFLNKIADMVILSALWCLYSLPLFTIGASTAALYHTIVKVIRQDRGYTFQTFNKSFRENFRSTALPSVIFLLFLAAACFSCYLFWDATETILENSYFFFSFLCVLLIILIMIHTFASTGRFNLSKNELITVITRLTFGHLFMNFLILCLIIAAIELVIWYIPLILFIVPSGLFYLISLIEEPMYKKHIKFEDDWNTDLIHNENLPFHKKDTESSVDTTNIDE